MALARVDATGAHAARLLADAPPFVREMTFGVLRWQLTLDTLLARHLRMALASLEPRVRAVLRAGSYEVLRMDTPIPVAVAEAVRVAKGFSPGAGRLVNAVLRRMSREEWPELLDSSVPLAIRFSHPEWLLARWRRSLTESELLKILHANQMAAPLAVLAGPAERAALESAGAELEGVKGLTDVYLVRSHPSAAIAALRAGRVYALDPTAAAVARLLPPVDGPILEVAAAPGGKSLVLAQTHGRAWRAACDRHLGRTLLMRSNLRRAQAPPALFVADGTSLPFPAERFAAVVLDAPCSGTGTLKRRPEIRWRLRTPDIDQLAVLQRRLVGAAVAALRPGGLLLYATCSLEPEENAAVLAGHPLVPVDVAERVPPGFPVKVLPGGVALIPPHANGDGFSVFLGRRTG